jgi:hypothetical protein
MTRDEAIEAIRNNWPDERYSMLREALTVALVALVPVEPRTCGTCRHLDDAGHGPMMITGRSYGFCAALESWHKHRPMPPDEGCTSWDARDEDDGA